MSRLKYTRASHGKSEREDGFRGKGSQGDEILITKWVFGEMGNGTEERRKK